MNVETTLQERGSRYGTFEDNAMITQAFMDVMAMAPNADKLHAQHLEAFHMIFHKISRAICGDCLYVDGYRDIIGYTQLLMDYVKTCEGASDAEVTRKVFNKGEWKNPVG